jgi:hypothetical protein
MHYDEYVWTRPSVQHASDDLLTWLVQENPLLSNLSVPGRSPAAACAAGAGTTGGSGRAVSGRELVAGALRLHGARYALAPGPAPTYSQVAAAAAVETMAVAPDELAVTLHPARDAALDALAALAAADVKLLEWYRDKLKRAVGSASASAGGSSM